jgi:hypothetical protein
MRALNYTKPTKEKPVRQGVNNLAKDENELIPLRPRSQNNILHLQRLIGNQEVQRLLAQEKLAHTREHPSRHTRGLPVLLGSIQCQQEREEQITFPGLQRKLLIQRFGDDDEAEDINSGGSWFDKAVDAVTEAGSSAYSSVSDTASSAYGTVSETAGEAYDWARDTAGGAWDTATDTAGEAYDRASETAGGVWDRAGEAASDAYDWASDTAGNAWDTVTDAAGEAWDWAGEKASDLGDWASDTWDTVSEGVSDAGDWASEKGEDAWDAVKDAGGELMSGIGVSREELEAMVRGETITQVNAHTTALEQKFTVKDLDTYREHDEPLPPIPSFGDFSGKCCQESELDNLVSRMKEQQLVISSAESARQVIVDKAKVEVDQLVKNYKADLISSLLSYAVVGAIVGAIIGSFFAPGPGTVLGAVVIAAVLAMVGMYVASAKMEAALTALLKKAKIDLRAANTKIEVEKLKYEAMTKSATSCSNNLCK